MTDFFMTDDEIDQVWHILTYDINSEVAERYFRYEELRYIAEDSGLASDIEALNLARQELADAVYNNEYFAERILPERYAEARMKEIIGDDFRCPTGECGEDKVCEDVSPGDQIYPYSREHIERNACNRCPAVHPSIGSEEFQYSIAGYSGTYEEITFYIDSEGNIWVSDNARAAHRFHGDPYPPEPPHILLNRTLRLSLANPDGEHSGASGWQCRYVNGHLDDETAYMGTYDYASPNRDGLTTHYSMDVATHNRNGFYVPNLTERIPAEE